VKLFTRNNNAVEFTWRKRRQV